LRRTPQPRDRFEATVACRVQRRRSGNVSSCPRISGFGVSHKTFILREAGAPQFQVYKKKKTLVVGLSLVLKCHRVILRASLLASLHFCLLAHRKKAQTIPEYTAYFEFSSLQFKYKPTPPRNYLVWRPRLAVALSGILWFLEKRRRTKSKLAVVDMA